MKSLRASHLLLNCDFLSPAEYRSRISHALTHNTLTHIVTLNAEMVVEAQKNKPFRDAVEHAELKIPDGSSMLWAQRYMTERHPRLDRGSTWIPAFAGMTASLVSFLFSKQQPLTGVDSIFTICELLEQKQGSAYLLGGTQKEREGTARVLQNKYPNLSVQALGEDAILSLPSMVHGLPSSSALFVALGSPKQTLWIEQNREQLEKAGIKIAIGVGGAFAMISGTLPRAPLWMRRHHVEWLWRLMLEPRRIKRIWNAVVVFPITVQKEKGSL